MTGSFVLTVDIEPDDRLLERRRRPEWQGFLDLLPWIERLRERLNERTGCRARFNWFLRMDSQIETTYGDIAWAARRYAAPLAELRARGDSIGLHHHAFRWHEPEGRWISDFGDEAWIESGVARALDGFVRGVGGPPDGFRFGDHWLSDRAVALLERLKIPYDLTLEPGLRPAPSIVPGEGSTGSLPDFQRAPRRPYRPSRSNYLEPGGFFRRRRLWLVPVSTGCINGPPLPVPVGPQHDFVHLNLGLDPAWIRHILDGLMDAEEPIVVSVARTGDFVLPGGRDRFRENLEYVTSHPRVRDRVFEGPQEAVSRWCAFAKRTGNETRRRAER